jgi:hypothetical protein
MGLAGEPETQEVDMTMKRPRSAERGLGPWTSGSPPVRDAELPAGQT